MDLHTCVIVLKNHRIISSKSVELAIELIARDSNNEISEIQINTTDGVMIQTHHYNNLQDSLDSLMSL